MGIMFNIIAAGNASAMFSVPAQRGVLTYNKDFQSPQWSGYDEDYMTMSGTLTAINAGTYLVTVKLTHPDITTWADGSTTDKTIEWVINRCPIPMVPSPKKAMVYTGFGVSPEWDHYDIVELRIGGTNTAIDIGDYVATFTPTANYCWLDGTFERKDIQWSIVLAAYPIPTQRGTPHYSGDEIEPEWDGFDESIMTMVGDMVGTDAGEYIVGVAFTNANCVWEDGTNEPKAITWVIARAPIMTLPSQKTIIRYDSTEKSPEWNNYDTTMCLVTGTLVGTDAGKYPVAFVATDNYQFGDDNYVYETFWEITKGVMDAVPTQTNHPEYTGEKQRPEWDGYNSQMIAIAGELEGVDAGEYTAKFYLIDSNFQWLGGVAVAENTWEILKHKLSALPVQTNNLVYNDGAQVPTFTAVDGFAFGDAFIIRGPTFGINAKVYTITIVPNENFTWADGTTDEREITWEIEKADCTIDYTEVKDLNDNVTGITIDCPSDGEITVWSSDDDVATATITGNTVNITPVAASGSAVITVRVAAGTNYNSPMDLAYTYTIPEP